MAKYYIQHFLSVMDRIMEIATKHGIYVHEDACQSDGGMFMESVSKRLATPERTSSTFFKIITAGEGGALTTNSRKLYERADLSRFLSDCLLRKPA